MDKLWTNAVKTLTDYLDPQRIFEDGSVGGTERALNMKAYLARQIVEFMVSMDIVPKPSKDELSK